MVNNKSLDLQQSQDRGKKISEAKKRYWQNEANRVKASERTRKQWADPEHRQRHRSGTAAYWAIQENRQIARERARAIYSHETPRQNVSAALRKKWQDEEFRQKHAYEKNPFYIDGRCDDPYGPEFNLSLKRSIRERDHCCCRNCGAKENGRRLEVHHIDYNKRNNARENLIYICKTCHDKTQARSARPYWRSYYQAMQLHGNSLEPLVKEILAYRA